MQSTRPQNKFANHEIVTIVVYLLGGESLPVDTEDVAVRANEIAPGRFLWRKYPDQINIENVRTFLKDATRPKNGGYLAGSGRRGWLLTEAGREFAKVRVNDLRGVDLSREPLSQKERTWRRGERARMLAEEAFRKFQEGGTDAVSSREAEAFFRVDDYVVGKARERKIVRVVNTFGDDPELGSAVKELAAKVRGR
jgi:hypothetical protein